MSIAHLAPLALLWFSQISKLLIAWVVAFLPAIPLFASVGGAGGGFWGFLAPANGASV
jgi:hypothetical protein